VNQDDAVDAEDAAAPTAPTAPAPPVPFGKAAIVGVAAGLLGGLFGVGGGLIMVPGLVGVVKMERRRAHGTSLAATLPISIASLLTYLSHGNVDWGVALFITIGALAGAIVGTHLLRVIPKNVLVILFVVTVLLTATRLLFGSSDAGEIDITTVTAVVLVLVGFVSGTLAGLLGIGGGVIMVPAMVTMGMSTLVAKGTSVAVIVPTAVMGTFRNRKHANVDLRAAGIVGGFGVATAVIGGTISDRLSDRTANIMFAALLLFVAVNQLLSLRPERPAAGTAGTAEPTSPTSD
jgi:uncharacterized membrane protein YfcA